MVSHNFNSNSNSNSLALFSASQLHQSGTTVPYCPYHVQWKSPQPVPGFIRGILPKLPPAADPNAPFDSKSVTDGMKPGKDHAPDGLALTPREFRRLEREDYDARWVGRGDEDLHPTSKSNCREEGAKKRKKEAGLLVVYSLHGCGFVAGSNDTEDLINRQHRHSCDALVRALEYRLVPKHPVTSTIFADAQDRLKWMFASAEAYGGDVRGDVYASGAGSGGSLVSTPAYRSKDKELNIAIKGMILR